MSNIVIIEEDDLMRGLLHEWLTAAGHAVRKRGLHEPPAGDRTDLVIIDLHMPRQSGVEVVRAVQQAHRGTPVIAISARFRPGLEHSSWAAQALGVRQLIAKPFTREDLLEAVRAVIGPFGASGAADEA
jgi:DNA-binding response OmpR family regulator